MTFSKQAFPRLVAQASFRELTVKDFLDVLHQATSLVVTFPTPDRPHLCARDPRVKAFARAESLV